MVKRACIHCGQSAAVSEGCLRTVSYLRASMPFKEGLQKHLHGPQF